MIALGIVLRQYALVIVANLSLFQMGLTLGWLSPALVALSAPAQGDQPAPLTPAQGAWLVSISCIVSLVGVLFTSPLADRIGRRWSLIVSNTPRLVSCVMLVSSRRPPVLLLARALCGIADFMGISVAATYASEVANREVRGGLGAVPQVLSALGSMLALTAGPFLSYHTLNIALLCLVAVTFVPPCLLPESPYYLYTKGKTEESINILTKLRGSREAAVEEMKEYSVMNERSSSVREVMRDGVFVRVTCKVVVLTFFFVFTGYTAVTLYLQTVLEMTRTSLRPEVSSAIIGTIQLLGCVSTILVVDRCGRKPVLLLALTGMAAGLIGLGIFFKLMEGVSSVEGFLNYLPLASLVLIIYCYNAGLGSQNWMLIAELYSGGGRALGLSLAVCCACFYTFITLRYFPAALAALTPAYTYWAFSACCLLMAVFIALALPETKGKNFSQIQRDMGHRVITKETTHHKDNTIHL